MLCNNCNAENRVDSKFCRSCGLKLDQPSTKLTITLPTISGLLDIVHRQNKKVILVSALVIAIGAGTAFAAPKINDFIKVNSFVNDALRLESVGDYQAASAALALTDNRWSFGSKRQEIEKLKENESKYAQFKVTFESALGKEKKNRHVEARELLQSIGTEYPEYDKVREKLNIIQATIEGNLEESARLRGIEAQRANAAAAEAQRKTQEEVAARTRAEAEKAASDAQARAAAQSARDAESQRQQADARAREAEYQRQLEEQKRIKAQTAAFLDEIVNIINRADNGVSYYNNAMSYYSAGSELTALAVFGQAVAVFDSTHSDALSMRSSYINLTGEYRSAVDNLINGTRNYKNSADAMISHIGSGSYGDSGANSYSSFAYSYIQSVYSFLRSQGR